MSELMSEQSQAGASWQDHFERLCAYFGDTAQQRCLLWVDPAQADPFQGSELVDQGERRSTKREAGIADGSVLLLDKGADCKTQENKGAI